MADSKPAVASKDSLRGWLQDARKRSLARTTIDLPIPRFEGRLWCTFRALEDVIELRDIQRRYETMDETDEAIHVAADTLIAACVDCFVKRDGKTVSLGVKLGLPLFEYLELTDETTGEPLVAENDTQAVFQIFESTVRLVLIAKDYSDFMTEAGAGTDRELEGNSVAPS